MSRPVALFVAATLAACSPRAPSGVVIGLPEPLSSGAAPKPRTIACGATTCAVGRELCCLDEQPRCVALTPPPTPKGYGAEALANVAASHRWNLCGHRDFHLCDDAGDCASGETCCRQRSMEADGAAIDHAICIPLVDGHVRCDYEELCNATDARCARKGNTCVGDPPSACAPPASGSCHGGRDCPEDQSCFVTKGDVATWCAYEISGIDPTAEYAICRDAADCAGACRLWSSASPRCDVDPASKKSACACAPRCTKDADCPDSSSSMTWLRLEIEPPGAAFCNPSGVCDARPRAP